MKTLSPAKEKAMIRSLLKDRLQKFSKNIDWFHKGKIEKSFNPALEAARGLKGLVSIFHAFFSKPISEESIELVERAIFFLEKVKTQRVFYRLAAQLVKDSRREKTPGFSNLVSDIQDYSNEIIQKLAKEVKYVKPKKVSKTLSGSLNSDCSGAIMHLMKSLNKNRKTLFDQVVKMIQTSRREELDELSHEVGMFCAALDLAVESGFEKGKRLFKTLEVLHDRLEEVRNEELFRRYIEELEKERGKYNETVRDVQLIRVIGNQLGISQAAAIQNLHAQLPPVLQLLKRPLS